MNNEKLRAAVNRSGFPLQIKVAAVVTDSHAQHGWRVLHSEHAWTNERDRQQGFIDLVLVDRYGTSVLVVECKRVLENAWVFLCPEKDAQSRRNAKTWTAHLVPPHVHAEEWLDLNVDPATVESAFCVVDGQDPKSRPMLERVAAELVSATEAFAAEERRLQDLSKIFTRVYANVIVTTANLKLCTFNNDSIRLSDGTLDQASFTDVPYLRFRKQLSTGLPAVVGGEPLRMETIARAKENTVFVVQADHLLDFLGAFEVSSQSLSRLEKGMR